MTTIPETIEAYLLHCKILNYTSSTIKGKTSMLKRFAEWCEVRSIKTYAEVTKDNVYSYQKFLYRFRQQNGDPLSVRTQEDYLRHLKSMFDWLCEEEYIANSPTFSLKFPKQARKLVSRGFTYDELIKIFGSCDPNTAIGIRNRCIMELMYCTAARRAEIANIDLRHIDHQKRTIFIDQGKGQKDGIVLYGKSATYWLDRYLKYSRPQMQKADSPNILFLSTRGKLMSPECFGDVIAKQLRKAGIKRDGAAHCFRHSFAVHMLERGMDSRYINEYLRHESLDTTKRYLALDISQLRKEFDDKFEDPK